jgi:hypothetical protein
VNTVADMSGRRLEIPGFDPGACHGLDQAAVDARKGIDQCAVKVEDNGSACHDRTPSA